MDVSRVEMSQLVEMLVTETTNHAKKMLKAGVEQAVEQQQNATVEAALGGVGVHVDMTV